MFGKKKIAAIGTSLVLAFPVAGALVPADSVLAPPPAAAGTSSKICNSSDSTDLHRIRVYDSVPGGWYYYVNHGACSPWISLTGALVNTCPDGNIFSYYVIKPPGGSYGTKHYGCNSDSNPANLDGLTYYKMMN